MKLKTRLLLATALTALVILGASEWLNYFNLATFVNGHEAAMARVEDHASMLAGLERAKHDLFRNLIWLHVVRACLTVLGLVVVLHILWWRLFLRPLESLLRHIHSMGLGTWTDPIPIERSDEIGDLIRAFNALGDQLGASVQQVAVTSRLSAMALLGGRVVRKACLVRDHVRAIALMLSAARQEGGAIPEAVIFNLMGVGADLECITVEFEMMFACRWRRKRVPFWRRSGPLHFRPFGMSLSLLSRRCCQNGPEQSRGRRCWARRSEPLTARTVLG